MPADASLPSSGRATSLWIVTGASRGLGAALVDAVARPGAHVVAIARRADAAGVAAAARTAAPVTRWSLDLAEPSAAAARLDAWLRSIDPSALAVATLVNNAATIGGPGALHRLPPAELSRALRVGLEAAVLLSAAFIAATSGWTARRRILNVSSGLGRRAMADTAAYCAVKAGLDHFSRALALEQARDADGVRVASVAPGVVDTDMQRELRGADAREFDAQPQFDALHRDGALATPAAAAARLLALLERADYGVEPVLDVRAE